MKGGRTVESLRDIEPSHARELIREGKLTKPTTGISIHYAQANFVVLEKELAYDFLLFCTRNPKPCPLLDVTEVGSPYPVHIATEADLRTDIPKYYIYHQGKLLKEVEDIRDYWNDDMVAFLLGCSFTFEKALLANDIPVRHMDAKKNVPMYKTNKSCKPAGRFSGPLVVSMRPIPYHLVPRVVEITSRFPSVHGSPVHIGEPSQIGIADILQPDYGDPPTIQDGDVPVFWACGVTPQAVAVASNVEFMITHSPGYMFISDIKEEKLSI